MPYYFRLDDACEKRDLNKWDRIEEILDKYQITPLVGVIPHCEDTMMDKYDIDNHFWERVHAWKDKGWKIALHGYNHVCTTEDGGINPINKRSEFAGVPLEIQREKIKAGIDIFKMNGIEPDAFFAPSHTFDNNTLLALQEYSTIQVISDTIANRPYQQNGFTFIPQQSGKVRKLPFNTVTFCYHPNTMKEEDFDELESFLDSNAHKFRTMNFDKTTRKLGLYDKILRWCYFARRH